MLKLPWFLITIFFIAVMSACKTAVPTVLDNTETSTLSANLVPAEPTLLPSIATQTPEPAAALPPLPIIGPAPEFQNDVWINSDGPLRLEDLQGKVVLLEFWTFG